jgi:hypothetical protein
MPPINYIIRCQLGEGLSFQMGGLALHARKQRGTQQECIPFREIWRPRSSGGSTRANEHQNRVQGLPPGPPTWAATSYPFPQDRRTEFKTEHDRVTESVHMTKTPRAAEVHADTTRHVVIIIFNAINNVRTKEHRTEIYKKCPSQGIMEK